MINKYTYLGHFPIYLHDLLYNLCIYNLEAVLKIQSAYAGALK